jgi:hypothetical protein
MAVLEGPVKYAPDVIGRDPHAMAMAAGSGNPVERQSAAAHRHARVDFHIARNSFSRWSTARWCFVAITNAIADMLVGDGIRATRSRS